MNEPLPLSTIHDAVTEFLHGRDDAVVFGATAVNACVDEPRMTQDSVISDGAICHFNRNRNRLAIFFYLL